VYKLAPFYPGAAGFGPSDARFLRSLDFNVVRVGVLWQAVEPQPGVYNRRYLRHIAGTVKTLGRYGIVSILDFHQDQYNQVFRGEGFPRWSVQDDGLPNTRTVFPAGYETNPAVQRAFENLWADKRGPGGVGLQERYAAAWKVVAREFRGNPSVLGYEIVNEPFPGHDYTSCAATTGCPTSDRELTSFYRKVDHAIRSVDPRTLIFYEPFVTYNFGYVDHVGVLKDPRAVFAWHDYCLGATSPCSSNTTTMQNANARVAKTGEGTFMTEFGASTSAQDLTTLTALADRFMVPWTEWAYCTCGDPTGAPYEGMVLDPHKPKTGSNLRASIIDSLVEPYPQVVAGTPRSWSFARSSRTFKLSYRVARASGTGRFPAASITQIAVPERVFHRGYAVNAQGGAIISRPGSRVLRIASCRGARTIKITVTPTGKNHQTCSPPQKRQR
jgi:endoglycosylceramidase